MVDKLCQKHFAATPTLNIILASKLVSFLTKSESLCSVELKKNLALDSDDIFTINHYYMDTVNKIKVGLANARATKGSREPAPTRIAVNDQLVDFSALVGISNEAQAAIDMQICLFAYWKVLHKRLCDAVPMIIRYSPSSTPAISRSALGCWSRKQPRQKAGHPKFYRQKLTGCKKNRKSGKKSASPDPPNFFCFLSRLLA